MIKRILIISLSVLLLMFSITVGYIYINVNQPITINTKQLITIEKGTSFSSFTSRLVELGIIDDRFALRNYVRVNPELSAIKSGTFEIKPGISQKELLMTLVKGKEHQFTITLIEGNTLKQWLEHIKQNQALKHTITDTSYANIATRLGIQKSQPEGLFFPDTYAFTKGTTDIAILKRAHKRMQKVIEQAWLDRDKSTPYKSQYEALIMASIIEKESGAHAEHSVIGSVFSNRLHKGMRLQTDPTVIYGLGDRYKGDIKRKHLREYTAYNTYRINGLPPTPIAMPGFSAIKGALNPASTEYYYFVSDGFGKHVFSKNLQEHNKAVAQYLKVTSNN